MGGRGGGGRRATGEERRKQDQEAALSDWLLIMEIISDTYRCNYVINDSSTG